MSEADTAPVFQEVMRTLALIIEAVGVGVIILGIIAASTGFLRRIARGDLRNSYEAYRTNMGKAILLGLEFLVAADIVATVTVHPTLENLAVLGLLVVIRTFLSFALELEVTGQWPWQGKGRHMPPAETSAEG
jgi:uncharacterized membrane protein